MADLAMTYRPDLDGTRNGPEHWVSDLEAGQFCYELGEDGLPDRFVFWAADAPWPVAIPIRDRIPGEGRPSWTFDGNMERPTLSPSIWTNRDNPPDWHGYVVAGATRRA